ncbi:hypothetical protein D3C78_1822120 [compost metagenome]
MAWARSRGDRPRKSARPCSVTMICVSCSVWSTCEHMGTMQLILPSLATDGVTKNDR